MSVKIVPYQDSFKSGLMTFMAKHSPDHPELYDERLFDWQRCQRYLALFKDNIVGHIAHIPQKFKNVETEFVLGWAATLVLDMSNPLIRVFAGTNLLDKTGDTDQSLFGAVGVVPEIEETHRRRGYIVNRDTCNMYARFFDPSRALAYFNRPAYLGAAILAANLLFAAARKPGDENLVEISSFNPSHDNIWEKHLASRYDIYGVRSAEFLNYRLGQPGKDYQVYIHREGPEIAGYIIFRMAENKVKNIRLLKICDLVGTDAARKILIAKAVSAARENKADGIVALASSRDKTFYRSAGLWVFRPFPVVLSPKISRPIHVTFFESDLDNLW